jgi:aryl-alcohol dehydrogenase-like predicted oxidoreductase
VRTRTLGTAGPQVSVIGLGCMGMSFAYGTGTVTSREQLGERDFRRNAPRFSEENFAANLALVERVRQVAAEIGCTPAQAALAWVLAQGEDIVAIPGTKRVRYLEENAAAASIALSEERLVRLSAAVPAGAVAGERYPERAMRAVGH